MIGIAVAVNNNYLNLKYSLTVSLEKECKMASKMK
jgi:hypothetical protein